jgi:hypothetical protein
MKRIRKTWARGADSTLLVQGTPGTHCVDSPGNREGRRDQVKAGSPGRQDRGTDVRLPAGARRTRSFPNVSAGASRPFTKTRSPELWTGVASRAGPTQGGELALRKRTNELKPWRGLGYLADLFCCWKWSDSVCLDRIADTKTRYIRMGRGKDGQSNGPTYLLRTSSVCTSVWRRHGARRKIPAITTACRRRLPRGQMFLRQ